MEDYFLKQFNSKSDQELLQIICRKEGYQKAAVNAAITLYNGRNATTIPSLYDNEEFASIETNTDSFITSFELRPFLKTLSYREFLSSFALGSFYLAYITVINYYSDELEFDNLKPILMWIGGLGLIVFNHMIYKFEHNRSNNFIGRVIHDLISLFFLVIVKTTHSYIVYSSDGITFDGGFGLLVSILFLVVLSAFFMEAMVAFIKFILRRFKCQIF